MVGEGDMHLHLLVGREEAKHFSPWVVVSPFVPARGTTPLSTCWGG